MDYQQNHILEGPGAYEFKVRNSAEFCDNAVIKLSALDGSYLSEVKVNAHPLFEGNKRITELEARLPLAHGDLISVTVVTDQAQTIGLQVKTWR